MTIASGFTLNLNQQSPTIGGLNGQGTVVDYNGSNNPATLSVGFSNNAASFSGVITGNPLSVLDPTKTSLSKVGTGTQSLTGANVYTGATKVYEGGLTLSGSGTLSAPAAAATQLSLYPGATFTMDDSGTNIARITNDTATSKFNLNIFGGTLALIGQSNTVVSQTLGTLTAAATGNPTISVATNGTAASTTLTFASLNRNSTNTVFNFTSNGGLGAGGSNPSIQFGSGTSNNTVLDFGTVNYSDFAVYGTTNGIAAMADSGGLTNYTVINGGPLVTGVYNHVNGSAGVAASGAIANISGVRIDDNVNLSLTGAMGLKNTAGIIKSSGGNTSTISQGGGGSITPNTELDVTVADGTLAVNVPINGGGAVLTKAGPGTLVLGAANGYTGTTFLTNGTLQVGTGPGTVTNAINSANTLTMTGSLTANGAANNTSFDIGSNAQTLANINIDGGQIINTNGAGGAGTAAGILTVTGNLKISAADANAPFAQATSISTGLGKLTFGSGGALIYNSNNTTASGQPGTATINGIIDINGARTFTVNGTGAYAAPASLDIEASIIDSNGTPGLLTINGNTPSVLKLGGVNTFAGNLTISNSAVQATNASSLGSTSVARLVTVSGGNLVIDGGVNFNNSNLSFSLNGTGNANPILYPSFQGTLVGIGGNNTIAGAVNLAGAATISVPNQSNTFSFGDLSPSATGSLLTKVGFGTLDVTGGAADLPITVTNGTLELAAAPAPTAGRLITVANTATLKLDGVSLITNDSFNISGIGLGSGTSGAIFSTASDNNTVAGAITLGASSTTYADTSSTLALTGAITSTVTLTVDGPGSTTLGGLYAAAAGGLLTKNGTGTLTLSLANTYTGATAINMGTVKLGVANAIPAGSKVTMANGLFGNTASGGTATLDLNGNNLTLTNALIFGGTSAVPGVNATVVDNSTAIQANKATITLNGGLTWFADGNQPAAVISSNVSLGAAGRTFTVNSITGMTQVTTGTPQFTISGNIAGTQTAGTTALTLTGGGVLNLSGTNTFTGDVVIAAGTLQFGSNGAIPSASRVTLTSGSPVSDTSPTLDINGFAATIGALASTVNGNPAHGINTVKLGTGSLTMGDGTNTTYTGIITGTTAASSNALIKQGSGTLTLSQANPFGYTGKTVVNAGTLQAGVTNTLAFATELNLGASGTFDLNAITGNTTRNLGATVAKLTGTGTLANLIPTTTGNSGNGIFTVGYGDASSTFSGKMTIPAANPNNLLITKIGIGTFTFDATNTVAGGVANPATGLITVNGGSFILDSDVIGNGAVSAATLNVNQGGTLSLDNTFANFANRTPAASTITSQGGAFLYTPNSAGGSATISNLAFGSGASTITVFGSDDNAVAATGGILINPNNNTLGAVTNGATTLIRGDGLGTTLANGVADIKVTSGLGTGAVGGGGATGSTTMTIRPDIIADATSGGSGTGFLTANISTDANPFYLRPLTVGELAVPTATFGGTVAASNAGLTGSLATTMSTSATINSLTITNTGGLNINVLDAIPAVGGSAPSGLTITSGGLLATSSATIGSAYDSVLMGSTNTTFNTFIHTVGASTDLTLSASIFNNGNLNTGNAANLVKDGAGTLTITAPQYFTGDVYINGGTVQLASGQDNTFLVQPLTVANNTPSLRNLYLNSGTLDLDGHNQVFGALIANANPTYGSTLGSVTNTSGSANFTVVEGYDRNTTLQSTTFGGTITDSGSGSPLSFTKDGGQGTLTLTNVNNYHGDTTIRGGTLQLSDQGQITNSANVNIDYGILQLNNYSLYNVANRLNTAATVNLHGGAIGLISGPGVNSTQTVATINAFEGLNMVYTGAGQSAAGTPSPSGTGNATLTVNNLVQGSSTSVVNIIANGRAANDMAASGEVSSGGGAAGFAPVVGTTHVLLGQINGGSVTTTNDILPVWITVGNDWAAYDPTLGVGALGGAGNNVNGSTPVGVSAFPAYSNRSILYAGPTDNVNNTSTILGVTTRTINTLKFSGGSIYINSGQTLTLGAGGLLHSGAADKGVGIFGGAITSGTNSLYMYQVPNSGNGELGIIGSQITNGAAGAVTLVYSGLSSLGTNQDGTSSLAIGNSAMSLVPTVSNNYSGGTIVNGTATGSTFLYLDAGPGIRALGTGPLTINNALVMEDVYGGQIDPSTVVTINGNFGMNLGGNNNAGSSPGLYLAGSDTLAGVNINVSASYGAANNAKTGGIGVNIPAGTTLTLTGDVSASNDSFQALATITTSYAIGTAAAPSYLDLNNRNATFTITGSAPVGMVVSSVIQDGGIIKKGPSTLFLSAANNTFSGVSGGPGITLNNGGLAFNNGTAGEGSILINADLGATVSLMAGSGPATISNPITVSSNFTFGGTFFQNNLTLAGKLTLTTSPVITVSSEAVTGTISGQIDPIVSVGITKAGPGTLVLAPPTYGNAINNYTGATTINAGVLRLGGGSVIPDVSRVVVNSAGTFSVNGFSETIGSLSGSGQVVNNSTAATLLVGGDNTSDAVFSGVISASTPANLGITKVGSGLETLTGINTYAGTTTISGGVLQANDGVSLPNASFLSLDGGVLQSNSGYLFTRGLATSGASKFQFTANGGGFSATGGTLTVNIGGSSSQVQWGTTVGTQIVGPLLFGSATANAQTVLQNPIDLNSAIRTINVASGLGGDSALLSGVLLDSGSGGGLLKTGAGILQLSNSNTYGGGTTLSAGTIIATNGTTGSATGGGTVTLNGGTLAGTSGLGGTISGPVQAGSGAHTIAPGFGLSPGTFGTLTLSGGLTTNSNTTLAFNLGTTTTSTVNGPIYLGDLLNVSGPGLTVSGSPDITFGTDPSVAGDYRLIGGSFGSPAIGNFVLPASPGGVTYSLTTTDDPGFIDLKVISAGNSTLSLPGTALTINMHVGDSGTPGVSSVTNSNLTDSGHFTATSTGTDALTLNPSTNTLVPANSSVPLNAGWSSTSTAGSRSGQITITNNDNPADNSNVAAHTQAVSGGVYNFAAANTIPTVNLGPIHEGLTASQTLTLTNVAPTNATYTETLTSSGFSSTTSGFTATGSVNTPLVAGGSSDTTDLVVGAGASLSPGHNTGTTTLALASNAVNSSGLGVTNLTGQTVNLVADVYSGDARWNLSTGGDWLTQTNWADNQSAELIGTPGISGVAGDKATFGPAVSSGSPVISLNSTAPILAGITFNNSAASYNIAPGSGSTSLTLNTISSTVTPGPGPASVVLTAGSHTISAPVNVVAGVTVTGAGTLTLSGGVPSVDNNSFQGPINIGTGTDSPKLVLNVGSASTVAAGVVATVAAGATLELDGTNSALTDSVTPLNRASVVNNGTFVAGASAIQQVGGIDGTNGSVVVSAGAALTADHIVQNSLVIGAGSTFTIAPSAADGSPMADALAALGQGGSASSGNSASTPSGGLVLAGSLVPSSSYVASSAGLLSGDSASASPSVSLGGSTGGAAVNAVPEPSTILLLLCGGIGILSLVRRKRSLA